MGRDQVVQRLRLPEGVVGRMGGEAAPERELVEAVRDRIGPGGTGVEESLVVVVGGAGDGIALALHAGLARDVVEVGLAEGAVMEPVVAHPAIDHRALGGSDPQRRMRVQQGHGHRPAVIGGADLADAAVGLRHVLGEPVGGVPGVGGVVGLRRVEGADRRAGHGVGAVRAVFAADILEHEDVAVVDPRAVGRPGGVAQVGHFLLDEEVGIVGGALQQHRQAMGAVRHDDDGVQPRAVAHGDHHLAPVIVVVGTGCRPMHRDVATRRRLVLESRRRRCGGLGAPRDRQGKDGDGQRGGDPQCHQARVPLRWRLERHPVSGWPGDAAGRHDRSARHTRAGAGGHEAPIIDPGSTMRASRSRP